MFATMRRTACILPGQLALDTAATFNAPRKGRKSAWALAGPAIVASVAYMDPGNFATNIQAGSTYGYELLWVVVLSSIVAMLF